VKRALKLADVNFELNHRIVRGLDYYMRTTFEFTTTKLGAQNAVLAGGRYDGLVKDLGGPEVPGIGFALGMERLVMLLAEVKAKAAGEDLIYFAVMGAKAIDAAVPVIQTLRKDGVRVEWDYGARSLKAQMRRAGKLNAESVVIIGDEEIAKGHAVIKNMRTGEQSEARLKDLPMHFVNIGG
jgi:histidyl-tRNA synthetase